MISELRNLLQKVKAIVFDFDGTLVYPINADWGRAKEKINTLMTKKKDCSSRNRCTLFS